MILVDAVVLTGRLVRLEPLTPEHHDALVDATLDGRMWDRWYTNVPSPDTMADAVTRRLEMARDGAMLPLVAVRVADDVVLGMTSLYDPVPDVPRVSIGWTWNRASAHGTGTNAESKLLLLRHCFETLDVVAVRFETSWSNRQSQAAIERLGARRDGVLRAHRRESNGVLGDVVVYSLLAHEWPSARASLEDRLSSH